MKTIERMSLKHKIGWIMTITIPLLIMLIPSNSLFTGQVRLFFAITSCAIIMLAFEVLPFFIPSILLPVMYIVFKLAAPVVAFSAWTTFLPWMLLTAFLIINILERIGLLERVAYLIIIKTKGTYQGLLIGMALIGILFNFFLTGANHLTLIPLAYGICKSLKLDGTQTAAGIILAAMLGANLPALIFYNPGYLGLELNIAGPLGVTVGWLETLFHNIIFFPLVFIMIFIAGKMFKQDVQLPELDYFINKYKSLEKVTPEETKAIFILITLVILLMTSGIHGIGIGWIFVIMACMFYMPGINIGSQDDLKQVNLSLVLFVAACTGIGSVSSELNIGQLIADMVIPMLQNTNKLGIIIIIWILAVIMNFMLTPLAAIAAFTVPIVQISLDLNINPLPIIYILNQGLDQLLLPYEKSEYLFAFSFNMLTMGQFLKFHGVKMLVNIIYIIAIAVPYWRIIGLL